MATKELELAYQYFQNACHRLDEALSSSAQEHSLVMDASIQRFEFTFEMCWKALKRFLLHQGIRASTPRTAFREAFRLGWLEEGDSYWYQMLEDRNLTSHTYDENIARDLYGRLSGYSKAFGRLLHLLQSQLLAGGKGP